MHPDPNDLKEISPDCVTGDGLPDDADIENFTETPYSLDYSAMIAKLTLAVQELAGRHEAAESKIAALEAQS